MTARWRLDRTIFTRRLLEPPMPYTLWSHDRLLGHTGLDYVRCFERHRMGDFHPTEIGEKLMPIVTGVAQATLILARSISSEDDPCATDTTEYADTAAAQAHYDALELELRGPDGSVIPTEWISVRDLEYLQTLVDEREREED